MITSLLLGLLLGIYHVTASKHHSQGVHRRDSFDDVFYVYQGTWPCDGQQVDILEDAIYEAHTFVQKAIDILSVAGAETSIAYDSWFGADNATPEKKDTILNRHYMSVLDYLQPPGPAAAFRLSHSPHLMAESGFTITGNSLVYACAPSTAELCVGNTVAAVQSRNDDQPAVFGATVLVLCSTFFEEQVTSAQFLDLWKKEHTIAGGITRAFTLVHEVQHMIQATGDNERCTDMPEPNEALFGEDDCYSASCCFRLPDRDKTRNAQNYALFALDVLAFPETGAPTCQPVMRKRQEPLLQLSGAATTFKTVKARNWFGNTTTQMPTSSIRFLPFTPLSSSANSSTSTPPNGIFTPAVPATPKSEISTTPNAIFTPPVVTSNTEISTTPSANFTPPVYTPKTDISTTPKVIVTPPVVTPTPVKSTTELSTTTTTTSGTPTPSVYEISHGWYIIVPIGALVFGGPGGGFAVAGGIAIAVVAGQTIRADPKEQQKNLSTDDQGVTTTTETTLDPCATTTTLATTTAAYGADAAFKCEDIAAMDDKQFSSAFPGYGNAYMPLAVPIVKNGGGGGGGELATNTSTTPITPNTPTTMIVPVTPITPTTPIVPVTPNTPITPINPVTPTYNITTTPVSPVTPITTPSLSSTTSTTAIAEPTVPAKPVWTTPAGWEKVFEADGVASVYYTNTWNTLSDGIESNQEQWCIDKCGDGCHAVYLLRQLQKSNNQYNPYFICATYSTAWSNDYRQDGFEGRVDSGVAFNKL